MKKEEESEKTRLSKNRRYTLIFLAFFLIIDLVIFAFVIYSTEQEEKPFDNYSYDYLSVEVEGVSDFTNLDGSVLAAGFDSEGEKITVLSENEIEVFGGDLKSVDQREIDFEIDSYRFNNNLFKQLGLSGNGEYYYYVDQGGKIIVYETESKDKIFEKDLIKEDLKEGELSQNFLDNLTISFDGGFLAMHNQDKIKVWNIFEDSLYREFSVDELKPSDFIANLKEGENLEKSGFVSKQMITRDNTKLISLRVRQVDSSVADEAGFAEIVVDVWNIKEEKKILQIENEIDLDYDEKISLLWEDLNIDFDDRSDLLAFSIFKKIYIYDIDGEKINQIDVSRGGVSDLAFGIQEKRLIVSYKNLGGLSFWNYENEEEVKNLYAQEGLKGFSVDYKDGEILTFSDEFLVVWSDSENLKSEKGNLGFKKSIEISKQFWNEDYGALNSQLYKIIFDADGKKVLFLSSKGEQPLNYPIQVWSSDSWERIFEYPNFSDSVGGGFFESNIALLAGGLEGSKFPEIERVFVEDFDEDGGEISKNYYCDRGLKDKMSEADEERVSDYESRARGLYVGNNINIFCHDESGKVRVVKINSEEEKAETVSTTNIGNIIISDFTDFSLSGDGQTAFWKIGGESYLIDLKNGKQIDVSKEFEVENYFDFYLIPGTEKLVFLKNLDAKRVSLELYNLSDSGEIEVNTVEKEVVDEETTLNVLGFSPDGRFAAFTYKSSLAEVPENKLVIYDFENKEVFDTIDFISKPNAIGFSPDNKTLIVSTSVGFVRIFEIEK